MTANEQQAFPLAYHLSQSILPGMTLRDYFATKAMEVLRWENPDRFMMCANLAYEMADAMLKARELK
jgi:hypothetical protein